jgi:hypothetical protein
LGADRQWPSLYDPKMVSLGAREFGFIGFDRHADDATLALSPRIARRR